MNTHKKWNACSAWLPVLALASGGLLSSCASSDKGSNPSSSLYGSLAPVSSLADFRDLQGDLQGMTMKRVVDELGSPAEVQDFGGSESWQYNNVAYDSVTKRPVRELTVWFEDGAVDDIRASF